MRAVYFTEKHYVQYMYLFNVDPRQVNKAIRNLLNASTMPFLLYQNYWEKKKKN